MEELHQAYQRVRVANSQYGAEPQTCDLYNELHARLGRDPTKVAVWIPLKSLGPATNSEEEDQKEKDNGEQEWQVLAIPLAKIFFEFLLQSSQSHKASTEVPEPSEGTSGKHAHFFHYNL